MSAPLKAWIAEYKPKGCRRWRSRCGECCETATEAMQALAGAVRYRNERARNLQTGEIVTIEQNARGAA